MQTVMTALIERIRSANDKIKYVNSDIDFTERVIYGTILEMSEELIKQERDQIEEAFDKGNEWEYYNGHDYYNQTYGGTYGTDKGN